MAIQPISIPPLQERNPIVDNERRPVVSFIRALNNAFRQISASFNGQAAIVEQLAILAGIVDDQGDLIAAQQTQIDTLETTQADAASALSLQNSGVADESGNMTCNTSGVIIIPSHSRIYGDPALNPTVSVTGATLPTGESPGTPIYVFYDDPTRAGGAVSYDFSTSSSDIVQSGSRHSVGYVEVPSSGTQIGVFTRPR